MKTLSISAALFIAALAMTLIAPKAEARLTQAQIEAFQNKIEGMHQVVQHLIKVDLSCQSAADCVALPIGKRACGGPNGYVVASKKNPAYKGLQEAIKLVTQSEAEFNQVSGMMSICSMEMPPAYDCQSNACTAL